MSTELLIALGIPATYLVGSTAVLLKRDVKLHRFVQRMTSRDALHWNTMVGMTIAMGALRWALSRSVLDPSAQRTCEDSPCVSSAW